MQTKLVILNQKENVSISADFSVETNEKRRSGDRLKNDCVLLGVCAGAGARSTPLHVIAGLGKLVQ